jgi:hypothetical protein
MVKRRIKSILDGFQQTSSLSEIVDNVKSGEIKTKQFPAPPNVDITGEIDFIRFLDEDLRVVTQGSSDSVYCAKSM